MDVSRVTALFGGPPGLGVYDVTADGQRFLVVMPLKSLGPSSPASGVSSATRRMVPEGVPVDHSREVPLTSS
jgi:hypothetical protein